MSKSITDLKNCNEIGPLLSSLKLFLMTLTAILKDYNMVKKRGFGCSFYWTNHYIKNLDRYLLYIWVLHITFCKVLID